MDVNKTILSKYNSFRQKRKRGLFCYAPFSNMYFNVHGDVAPCWLGFSNPENIQNKTIKEIWFGEKFTLFRNNIQNLDLETTCKTCKTNIDNGNYYSVLSRAYDNTTSLGKYPVMMELELDNTCNFECIMCNQFLSSSIERKIIGNRNPKTNYDESFVEQLEEFIPYLHEIRFNGGEPFLIEIYYKIWERIIAINPKLKIVVATNGSIYNNRIEQLLEKGNFHINISIDSLKDERYAEIRKNGKLESTLNNFHKYLNYTKKKKNTLCVLINPMRNNWDEMPDFVKFCNSLNIPLWFNTIIHPKDLSLWALPPEKLYHIYSKLTKYRFTPISFKQQSKQNIATYNNLVNVQIYNWYLQSNKNVEEYPINSFEDIKNYILQSSTDNDLVQKIVFIEKELNKESIDSNLFFNLIKQYSLEEFLGYLTSIDKNGIQDLINKYLHR